MNYDEIKQEQLKATVPNAADAANAILNSIDVFTTQANTDSPLAQYFNLCRLIEQIDEIYHQAHIAALDYIRVKETKNFTEISHKDWEEEEKKTPYITKDGIEFQHVRVADFRNLATKDKVLNSLILNEREAKANLKRISAKIVNRITALRAMPEYKKAKPTRVNEAINIRYAK